MTPAEALAGGLVIGIPTDTVYGLACLPEKQGAVAKIFVLKNRGREYSLPVLCTDSRQAAVIGRIPKWAGRAWPGPVTLVVERTSVSRPWDLGSDRTSIAVRVPDHLIVRGLCAELGPIACTSANLHGEATPATAEDIVELFAGGVALVVDGGSLPGVSSNVVDARKSPPAVLRRGPGEVERFWE